MQLAHRNKRITNKSENEKAVNSREGKKYRVVVVKVGSSSSLFKRIINVPR